MAREAENYRTTDWASTVSDHKRRQLRRIGEAAFALVTDEGLAHASMSSLARAVGVSRATLYNYVPDIATALRLHLEMRAEDFRADLAAAIAQEDGAENKLRRYIHEQVGYVASQAHGAFAAMAELSSWLQSQGTPDAHHSRQSDALGAIVSEGIEQGRFQAECGERVLVSLIGSLLYGAHDLVHRDGLSAQEAERAITELVLEGIRP